MGGTRFECGMLYETHTYRDVGESACKVEFVSNEILCTDMSNSGSVMTFRNQCRFEEFHITQAYIADYPTSFCASCTADVIIWKGGIH